MRIKASEMKSIGEILVTEFSPLEDIATGGLVGPKHQWAFASIGVTTGLRAHEHVVCVCKGREQAGFSVHIPARLSPSCRYKVCCARHLHHAAMLYGRPWKYRRLSTTISKRKRCYKPDKTAEAARAEILNVCSLASLYIYG
jgi:hypothetical protein